MTTQETPEQGTKERFWARVEKTETCWLWTAYVTPTGYGRYVARDKRRFQAHRVAYELFVGPIPEGLTIDHLCRVRRCVNPAHLEPVTNRENVLRGESWTAVNARKTHCIKGHPLDAQRRQNPRWRRCRTCNTDQVRASYRRRHAVDPALWRKP